MAEYCMLFATSAEPTQHSPHPLNLGLAEGRYHYPLLFKLLVSGQPRLSRSLLTESKTPLAIAGDAAAGVTRLRAVREQLQSGAAAAAIDDVIERLSRPHVQRLPILILEPAELLGCSPAPAETQLQHLLSEICSLRVDEIARQALENYDPLDWPSGWADIHPFEAPNRIETPFDPDASSFEITPARLLESKSLLPSCKAGLVTLKVDLDDPLIGKATEALAALKDLWALDYAGRCGRLPDEVCSLEKLKSLSAVGVGLRELPESLASLGGLNQLDLSGNALSAFPTSLRELCLNTLTLNENRIRKIPDWIGEMKTLMRLRISNCMLSELPTGLFSLPELEKLELSNNPLDQLSENVGNLQCLRELSVDNCRLKTLPESLGRLQALEFLYVGNNRFETIPEVVRRLPLRTLSIGGNPFKRHFWSRWTFRARRVYFEGV